uniref:Uncharacterized protein n=1 Tax=Anopheles culicifacies TaxID=139723 RepID=A0A182MD95_9DIPT
MNGLSNEKKKNSLHINNTRKDLTRYTYLGFGRSLFGFEGSGLKSDRNPVIHWGSASLSAACGSWVEYSFSNTTGTGVVSSPIPFIALVALYSMYLAYSFGFSSASLATRHG